MSIDQLFIDSLKRQEELEAIEVQITGGGRGPTAVTSDKLITKSGDYTILATDLNIGYELFVKCTNTSSSTITLPDATSSDIYLAGATSTITVNRTDAKVTVDGNGSQTINGNLTITMGKGDAISMVSDGANWRIK